MPLNFASYLVLIALAAAILPPGYSAYIGAYIVLAVALAIFGIYGWRERSAFLEPVSLAILAAIALVGATLPFVYQSPADLLAPVFILPMLTTVALAMLARPASWLPSPTVFATICLTAAAIAALGGAYEHYALGLTRPGLGNNPIHYGSLAAMVGGLALVGSANGASPWRHVFLLGPALGLFSAFISGSRGPVAGALVMGAVGMLVLLAWFWRERAFRVAIFIAILVPAATFAFFYSTGNVRAVPSVETAVSIFRVSGGSGDIRAALYASALESLRQSPIVGFGHGQIMDLANYLHPDLVAKYAFDNLHADWANFASIAGGMGLIGYFLLVSAPLLLLYNRNTRRDRTVILAAVLLALGQITLGISNAMFGVLPQTVLYAAALGYFLMKSRRVEG